jgi:mannitol-1-phosphate/altronate dehydrogenase
MQPSGAQKPKYIRAINFVNTSGDKDAVVHVTFKTAGQKAFTIGKSATVSVEESIDKGSWTECDPIQAVHLNGKDGNAAECQAPASPEIRFYNLTATEGGWTWERD